MNNAWSQRSKAICCVVFFLNHWQTVLTSLAFHLIVRLNMILFLDNGRFKRKVEGVCRRIRERNMDQKFLPFSSLFHFFSSYKIIPIKKEMHIANPLYLIMGMILILIMTNNETNRVFAYSTRNKKCYIRGNFIIRKLV